MKYSIPETAEILGWTVLATALALLMARVEVLNPSFTEIPAGWATALYIVVGIGLGFLAMMFFEKLPKWMQVTFSIIGVFGWAHALSDIATKAMKLLNITVSPWIATIALSAMLISAIYLFYKRKWLRLATIINNIVFIIFFSVLSAMLGVRLTPFITVVLLLVIACYDAYAVWKAETMQKMAMNLVKSGIVPGISVYVYKEKRVGLFGGGDIFFICLASIVMMSQSTHGVGAIIGMWVAVLWIFIIASRDHFYPAIPFIVAGLFWGMIWQDMLQKTIHANILVINTIALVCLNLIFIIGVQYGLKWMEKKGYAKIKKEDKNGKEESKKKINRKVNNA